MMSSGFHFLFGQWLLLIPLLWGFLARWFNKPRNYAMPAIADGDLSAYNRFYHPFVEQLKEVAKTGQISQHHFYKQPAFWMYGWVFSCFLFALAQPVLTGKRLPDVPPERDIIFLVDVSLSMQLKDYQLENKAVRRIDVLHNLLDEFTTRMTGERISVILFAEQAYTLVPLTNDQYLIRRMLERINPTLAGRYSALGDALLMALHEAKKQPDRHQTFILFTDADTANGHVTPAAAAALIAEHHIPVFTVAIGASQIDLDKAVEGGLNQTVDLQLLEDIAQQTLGKSYQVNNTKAVEQALQEILQQRQNIAVAKPRYEQQTLYLYPLLLGLLGLTLLQIQRLLKHKRELT